MISVCIATYNGTNFIRRQLDTILPQLAKEDEIIIVDDCSKDNTVSLLQETYGNRVNVYKNETNIGVIKSFEKAISKAKGDIIFLCDQDDMWLENKVEKVLAVFETTNASLVVHDALVVDGDGEIIEKSWNAYNHNQEQGFLGTIIKNGFTGCCMAFKRGIIEEILPFPSQIEMHDQWIALVCMMEKQDIVYIREPLMKYVRHGGNVTGTRKRSLGEQVSGRFGTIRALMRYKSHKRVTK